MNAGAQNLHAGLRCVVHQLWLTFVFETDEECSWKAPEHECILGAVLADCGHVHNWQELLDVVHQQLVEEALIALLKCSQVAVSVQVIGHVAQIDEGSVCL